MIQQTMRIPLKEYTIQENIFFDSQCLFHSGFRYFLSRNKKDDGCQLSILYFVVWEFECVKLRVEPHSNSPGVSTSTWSQPRTATGCEYFVAYRKNSCAVKVRLISHSMTLSVFSSWFAVNRRYTSANSKSSNTLVSICQTERRYNSGMPFLISFMRSFGRSFSFQSQRSKISIQLSVSSFVTSFLT